MGLFSFLKDAGSKLFGKSSDDAAASAESKESTLRNEISRLDLGLENLSINVDGEKVSITGEADSQSEREKAILAVGNIQGVAVVNDNITVTSKEAESTFYTVQSGDTLSKIAKAQYGDPMKYPVIFEANKPLLSDPDKIYPGQVLRVPPLETA